MKIIIVAMLMVYYCLSISAQQTPVKSVDLNNVDNPVNVIVSKDESIVAIQTLVNGITLWDLDSNGFKRHFDYGEEINGSSALSFSSSKKYLIAGGVPSTAKLWNAETGELLHVLRSRSYNPTRDQFTYTIRHVDINRDETLCLTHDSVGNLQIWDIQTGAELYFHKGILAESIKFLEYSDLIFYRSGSIVRLFDYVTGEVVDYYTNIYHSSISEYNDIFMLVDLRPINDEYHYKVVNYNTSEELYRSSFSTVDSFLQSRISPDGKNILRKSTAYNGSVQNRQLIDVNSKNLLREYPIDRNAETSSPDSPETLIKYLPNGRQYLTVNGNKIHIWDIGDVVPRVENDRLHEPGGPQR